MNSELLKQIYHLGLTETEVEEILSLAPELEQLSPSSFTKNCKTFVEFGFPKIELDTLLLANPNLFTIDEEELRQHLEDLLDQTGDIEEALKTNHFSI